MRTIRELSDRLSLEYDEVSIVDMLDLTSEMILDRFQDRLEEREQYIRKMLDEEVEEVQEFPELHFVKHFDGYEYEDWN